VIVRRLLPYWRPALWPTVWGIVLLVGASGLELVQPWPIKWLVDYIAGSQPVPEWFARVWPAFGKEDTAGSLAAVCLAIFFLALLHRGVTTCSQLLLIGAGGRLVRQLRCHVCDHLHRLSLKYHDRTKVGDSLYRVAYDTQAAQSLLSGAVAPAAGGGFILMGILTVMLQMDMLLTVIALSIAPLFWLLIRGFGRLIERRSASYHQQESALLSNVQESLSAIRAVQAFTQESRASQSFQGAASRSFELNQRLVLVQLAFSACVGLAMAAGTAAVVWFGGQRVVQGQLTVGDILVFLAYLGMLYSPMKAFSEGAGVVQSASTQLNRVFEIVDTRPDVAEAPNAVQPANVEGRLELEDVDFEYEPGQPVLQNINLHVAAGQVLALVGRTGAGKSTLASLLLRLYDPVRGAIRLDGHDLRELPLSWLRQQVSIVLQDAILFSTSIAENIAYGRPDASRGEIIEAARQARADDFIRALPDGYDSLLGERGVNLSGGQRQRLSIARAFLKNAPILIFDEPTSALDAHTEEALLRSLADLVRGRTTLIIAHRLSTVRIADEIAVLESGSLVERGSPAELLGRDSAYRRFYRSQAGLKSTAAHTAGAGDAG
jgi:ATP-binding cassette subfamily B protein/subfamily B ATP-binding cassette protein MsbA